MGLEESVEALRWRGKVQRGGDLRYNAETEATRAGSLCRNGRDRCIGEVIMAMVQDSALGVQTERRNEVKSK